MCWSCLSCLGNTSLLLPGDVSFFPFPSRQWQHGGICSRHASSINSRPSAPCCMAQPGSWIFLGKHAISARFHNISSAASQQRAITGTHCSTAKNLHGRLAGCLLTRCLAPAQCSSCCSYPRGKHIWGLQPTAPHRACNCHLLQLQLAPRCRCCCFPPPLFFSFENHEASIPRASPCNFHRHGNTAPAQSSCAGYQTSCADQRHP